MDRILHGIVTQPFAHTGIAEQAVESERSVVADEWQWGQSIFNLLPEAESYSPPRK